MRRLSTRNSSFNGTPHSPVTTQVAFQNSQLRHIKLCYRELERPKTDVAVVRLLEQCPAMTYFGLPSLRFSWHFYDQMSDQAGEDLLG